MNIGQACILVILYGSIVVGLALELLGYRHARRNAAEDRSDNGADWGGEVAHFGAASNSNTEQDHVR